MMSDALKQRSDSADSNLCLCPHCGYNLVAERPVTIGRLHHDPARGASWAGVPVKATQQQSIILGTLVHARGTIVPRHILEERMGYEGYSEVVVVQLSRLRSALREAGAPPDLIQTVWGRGYRLNIDDAANDNALRAPGGRAKSLALKQPGGRANSPALKQPSGRANSYIPAEYFPGTRAGNGRGPC